MTIAEWREKQIDRMIEKIYVVSLRRDTERRRKCTERLNAINLPFEFFDAYDGELFRHLWKKLDNSFFTNPNYIACNLTHLSIYNDALTNGYKKILILEDDAVPHKDYNAMMDIIGKQIPVDYDLLYFGWIPLSDDCQYWNYNVINKQFITQNIFHSKNLWGLFAYSITENLMKEMIELYNNDFPMEIDRYFVTISPERKSYAIRPQMFAHDYGLSNNTGTIDENTFNKSIDTRIAKIENYLI